MPTSMTFSIPYKTHSVLSVSFITLIKKKHNCLMSILPNIQDLRVEKVKWERRQKDMGMCEKCWK